MSRKLIGRVCGARGELVAPVVSVALWLAAASAGSAQLFQTPVFLSGEEGYHGYRIPTIIEAANGDLLAIAEGRVDSFADQGNIDLVMRRSTDHGAHWGEMTVLRDAGLSTAGNPAPVVDRQTGDIHLLYSIDQSEVRVISSSDHGVSWSDPRSIHDDVSLPDWTWHVPGPVHGIQLRRGPHAGRLVIPSDHISASSGWGAHVLYSDDHGATWRLGGQVPRGEYAGATIVPNESTVVELANGDLYLNFRNHGPDANRGVALSSDGGLRFSDPQIEPTLIEPQVQASVLRYSAVDQGGERDVLLFSNPATDNVSREGRRRMTVRASFDEGETWNDGLLIEEGPAAYSDLVKVSTGEIGLLYETGDPLYSKIVFARFGLDAVDPRPFNGVEGDINQDGAFDLRDLEAFVAAWDPTARWHGGAHSYSHGDINFDLKTDLADVLEFRRLLIASALPVSALDGVLSLPERPSTALLSAAAGGLFVRHRPAK